MRKELGQIEPVRLRDVWATEPEFTRWLAQKDHLTALGEALGLDLTLLETEAGVGDFSADILAATAEGGASEEKVIIENQFGTTDHDHLGKLLTYSSGRDASYIVWIFENIREEHRRAIDWLNENTTDEVSFFAVQLELWQIGVSLPAPKFSVVCRPNDLAKTAKRQAATRAEMSEGKLRQQEFWEQFRAFGTELQSDLRFRTPRPQHWYDLSIGSSDARISLTVNTREGFIGCAIYIPDNKELFAFLQQESESIERELGTRLEWVDPPGKKAAYAIQYFTDFDILDVAKYPECFDWLIGRATAFHQVFAHRIKNHG
ncbi:MAG: DUF4268 domain-containing protein [Patescibacteria group bacterium]